MSEYYCSHNPPCCPLLSNAQAEIDRLKSEVEKEKNRCATIERAEEVTNYVELGTEKLKSLLSRLEAAETLIDSLSRVAKESPFYEAWYKLAGK